MIFKTRYKILVGAVDERRTQQRELADCVSE